MIRRLLLAVLSSGLLVLSFPGFDLHALAWIALVPLLVVLRGLNPARAFGWSLLTGLAFIPGVFYWLTMLKPVTWLDVALLDLYLGLYVGLFGLALAVLSRRTGFSPVLTAPPLWVSLEYLRANAGFLALPWAFLGHSQYLNLPLVQLSSITGVYGISFLIVMVNAAISELLLSRPGARPVRLALAALALVVASHLYGFGVLSPPAAKPGYRVAVVQGNIPQDLRWEPAFLRANLDKHEHLSREAARNGGPALVVWPETSVPGYVPTDLSLRQRLTALAQEINAHLLVGSAARPKLRPEERERLRLSDSARHNSAFLLSPAGRFLGQYHKVRLLPFGEYLPLKDVFPWPGRYAAKAGNFLPGRDLVVFQADGARFGVLICWEIIFPDLSRSLAASGAQFLVNMTNEAWFGDTAAPRQMLALAVFRAAENRTAIVRAANTGISGFIDPYGRILAKVANHEKDLFVEGHLTRDVPLRRHQTVYTRHGDRLAEASALVALGLLLLAFVRPSKWSCTKMAS